MKDLLYSQMTINILTLAIKHYTVLEHVTRDLHFDDPLPLKKKKKKKGLGDQTLQMKKKRRAILLNRNGGV